MGGRLNQVFREYGRIAIGSYLVIFVAVFLGFLLAIQSGVEVKGAAESAGLIGGAWLATKLTQPLRILATVAVTPVVARVIRPARSGTSPR
jgi:hypothetical protein